MNLDLLKKLTRLANNNPNDNEANLAARRVCKMLEEGNWNLQPVNPQHQKQNPYNAAGSQAKSASNPPQSGWDWFRDFYYTKQPYEPFSWKTSKEPHTDPFYAGRWKEPYREPPKPKNEQEKRPLKCTQCKKDVETAFVGLPETYVCNGCIWQNYINRERK